ncbi:iron chelate uptake ABC transporter family permease subunit [Streptomyces sp. BE20]|uniref:FecCD family ABC transporter permease n=1 Tax=Streptomyces sp. BE20 TaxID=3002525 RepID=UPI002E797C6E|nr:iron chelate uptake ABC transporter family permease subunit [Streptomyces sp. BE20]MEE1821399.1 iron chelate uptake ABC transporter family permease subunit [Streptomyces sp. BE20]
MTTTSPPAVRPAGPGRTAAALAVAAALLLATVLLGLAVGSHHEPVRTVIDVVVRRLGLGDPHVTLLDDQIVWQLRLPRVLGAAATGAGLAVCGAVLQTLTGNDLADPFLLGISDGAAAGAVTVIVLGVGVSGAVGTGAVATAAFAGALLAAVVVLALAGARTRTLPTTRTVLAGIAVGQMCGAYTSFAVLVLGDRDAARGVMEWTLGSVAGVRWPTAVFLTAVALAGVTVLASSARDLDAFAFGETAARSLGVHVERTRWVLVAVAALVTACLVAHTGVIGFLGLVVPHVVRLVCGPRHAVLLPVSALTGASLLVGSDILARSVLPDREIPVGVITAGLGAPFFAWLLWRQGRADGRGR